MQDYQNVHITRSFGSAPAVVHRWRNGQLETALNWYALAGEAMSAIEPEVRRRWRTYWDYVAQRATVLRDAATIDQMMELVKVPSTSYACPPQIAARAIWPSATEDYPLLVESRPQSIS